MLKINQLFDVVNAKSKGFESYNYGSIPFISNGFQNNGVVGFVEPFDDDKIFNSLSICVSAFCEATVQKPPFLPRGNGGSGMKILVPLEEMSYDELLFHASSINKFVKWRYSYGRMITIERLKDEEIELPSKHSYTKLNDLLKITEDISSINLKKVDHFNRIKKINITNLFTLQHGDFHSLDELDLGFYPCVSRIDTNNGIEGYYQKPEDAKTYPPLLLTVSTVTGDCFVQLDEFIATDNVVICTPLQTLKSETLFYISMLINKEKWRWMYGRQCYKTKFATTSVTLPVDDQDRIDEDTISSILGSTWGWKEVRNYLARTTYESSHNS